jgi:hypothetical protein
LGNRGNLTLADQKFWQLPDFGNFGDFSYPLPTFEITPRENGARQTSTSSA